MWQVNQHTSSCLCNAPGWNIIVMIDALMFPCVACNLTREAGSDSSFTSFQSLSHIITSRAEAHFISSYSLIHFYLTEECLLLVSSIDVLICSSCNVT